MSEQKKVVFSLGFQRYSSLITGLGCDWECESVEDGRRDSDTSSTSGHGSASGGERGKKNWDWTSSDNARTEQRMKKMKELQKK